jgi:predicted transcriptional regulator
MKLKDQKIKYKQIPPKEDLIELYKNNTLQEIANLYGTTKTRVRKWFDTLEIKKRPQGGGNNRRVVDLITKDELIELIKSKKTNKQIAKILGCSVSNICRLLSSYGLKREYNMTDYKKYSNKVRRLTEKNYVKYFTTINLNNCPRTLCGVDGGYQVDHKLSVRFSYDNNISEEVCASVDNLQMIEWTQNLNKRYVNIFEENYVNSN